MNIPLLTSSVLGGSWLLVAIGLWRHGRTLANTAAAQQARRAAARRFRALHLMSLVLLLALADWWLLCVWQWQWLSYTVNAGLIVAGVLMVTALMVTSILTAIYPEVPGRRWLRLAENIGIAILASGLAVIAVVGMRTAMAPADLWSFAGLAALSLGLGFYLMSRPAARGALILAGRVGTSGMPARQEATLKRLVRRHRPALVGGMLAVVLGIWFSVLAAEQMTGEAGARTAAERSPG